MIEFNPTIPTHIHFVQPADPAISQGTGLLPLVALGKENGYELISALEFNAFFVKQEYFGLFEIESNDSQTLRTDSDSITYLFSGFDGTIFLDGYRLLSWHNVELDESQFQYLPSLLRTYPGRYSLA